MKNGTTAPRKAIKPRKPRAKDEFRTVGDSQGNLLTLKNNGKRIVVYLKLTSENFKREIGVINLATRTIEIHREREKHLHRKMQAYGFNEKLLAEAKLFDVVRLNDEYGRYVIPKSYILENAKENSGYRHFLVAGFEKQIFLPLELMEQFRRKPLF